MGLGEVAVVVVGGRVRSCDKALTILGRDQSEYIGCTVEEVDIL